MKEYTLDGMAALVRLLFDEYKFRFSQIGEICVMLQEACAAVVAREFNEIICFL